MWFGLEGMLISTGLFAGGLLGARDGIEGIPERWLEKLQFRKEFEQVAMRILQLQEDSSLSTK